MTWMVIRAAMSVLIKVQTRISLFRLQVVLLLADAERARQHPHNTRWDKIWIPHAEVATVEVVFEPTFPMLLECICVVHSVFPAMVSACASSTPAPQARSGISTKSDPNAKGFGRRRALTCHRCDGRGSRPSCSAAHFYLSSRAHPSKASSLFEAVWKFWQRHFSKSWYKCGKIADVRFSRFLGHFYMHSVLRLRLASRLGLGGKQGIVTMPSLL